MDSCIKTRYFETKFGELILGEYEGKICLCDWRFRAKRELINSRLKTYLKADFVEESTVLHEQLIDELQEYFNGKLKQFKTPIFTVGSDFQQSVWKALLTIPYGKIITYASLSKSLGDEKAIRAVASANGANAIAILIPCHRVIASNGDLQGYAGGLLAKKKLLELEGAFNQTSLSL